MQTSTSNETVASRSFLPLKVAEVYASHATVICETNETIVDAHQWYDLLSIWNIIVGFRVVLPSSYFFDITFMALTICYRPYDYKLRKLKTFAVQ